MGMPLIMVSEEQLNKVLADVEHLLTDVSALLNQDAVAAQRLVELNAKPEIAKSEQELDAYLEQRGVDLGRVGDSRTSRFL